jgi:hypothetical protein
MNEAIPLINLLIMNGIKYDLDKIRDVPGPRIEVNRADIVTDINCSPVETGLHALTTERAAAGKEQTVGADPREYVPQLMDALIVIKHQGKLLLLLGHLSLSRSTKEKITVRLVTTVAMKEKAKLHVPSPPAPPAPEPVQRYPQTFTNAPRVVAPKAFPPPRSSNSNHPFRNTAVKVGKS